MISDAVCMFIYLFMMNYFPTNMTNLIYLIDSNINLISLIMIQKSWRIVIFPWKREKLNYRMSDRSFCQYDGPLTGQTKSRLVEVIRGQMNMSTRVIWLYYWWNSKVIVIHFATAVATIQVAHHFYHDQDQKDIQNPKILHPPLLSKISLLCLLLHWYKSEIKNKQLYCIPYQLQNYWFLQQNKYFDFGVYFCNFILLFFSFDSDGNDREMGLNWCWQSAAIWKARFKVGQLLDPKLVMASKIQAWVQDEFRIGMGSNF